MEVQSKQGYCGPFMKQGFRITQKSKKKNFLDNRNLVTLEYLLHLIEISKLQVIWWLTLNIKSRVLNFTLRNGGGWGGGVIHWRMHFQCTIKICKHLPNHS